MNMKKVLVYVMLGVSFTLVGCGAKKQAPTEQNQQQKVQKQQESSKLGYEVVSELLEIKDKHIKINYPQVKDYVGEILMDYMNQSLKKIVDQYNSDSYDDVNIDYEITKSNNEILSILYKGTGKIKDFGEIKIKDSMNLDMKSSNEINYESFIKNNDEVRKILDKKAKEQGIKEGLEAEGIRIYFKGDDVVFYYMPLDDDAKEFIEISIPSKELEGYVNTDFGEKPAS
ncbi:hypothetical protein OW763_01610 [Clostridium aestuarii]|uniref:DUF3298 domain-containing protein n=1 Tax=Clostridium aestuarii TaxID=338193 RepID=A0ABT4CVN6_9CLOT|nr:hypothetical protein [Clostridium aestuarii]MCY6483049.1 hypothetical protein [Clostridium aestuarii]